MPSLSRQSSTSSSSNPSAPAAPLQRPPINVINVTARASEYNDVQAEADSTKLLSQARGYASAVRKRKRNELDTKSAKELEKSAFNSHIVDALNSENYQQLSRRIKQPNLPDKQQHPKLAKVYYRYYDELSKSIIDEHKKNPDSGKREMDSMLSKFPAFKTLMEQDQPFQVSSTVFGSLENARKLYKAYQETQKPSETEQPVANSAISAPLTSEQLRAAYEAGGLAFIRQQAQLDNPEEPPQKKIKLMPLSEDLIKKAQELENLITTFSAMGITDTQDIASNISQNPDFQTFLQRDNYDLSGYPKLKQIIALFNKVPEEDEKAVKQLKEMIDLNKEEVLGFRNLSDAFKEEIKDFVKQYSSDTHDTSQLRIVEDVLQTISDICVNDDLNEQSFDNIREVIDTGIEDIIKLQSQQNP